METNRLQKIERLLQKELGDIFLSYAREIKGTIISVTNVRISPDLSVAHVHLSFFPTEKTAEILGGIQLEQKSIRYELGKRVRHQLRIIPDLDFHVDDSLDYLERIDALLKTSPPAPLTEEEKEEEKD